MYIEISKLSNLKYVQYICSLNEIGKFCPEWRLKVENTVPWKLMCNVRKFMPHFLFGIIIELKIY